MQYLVYCPALQYHDEQTILGKFDAMHYCIISDIIHRHLIQFRQIDKLKFDPLRYLLQLNFATTLAESLQETNLFHNLNDCHYINLKNKRRYSC